MRLLSSAVLALAILGAGLGPASAHPHVWVTARSAMVYGGDGRLAGIRHEWTFDDAYSAFALQGLDKGPDGQVLPAKMTELAKTNVESLAEFDYFTHLKANGQKVAFDPPAEYGLRQEAGGLTLFFLLPIRNGAAKADRTVLLDLYDPTFFVDFTLAEGDGAVKLVDAPKGCALRVQRPKPPDPAETQKLGEAFFSALTASASYGNQFANRALVACP